MASFALKLNNKAIGDLALRGEGVTGLVEQEGSRRAQALATAIGADNVVTHMGGTSRARMTIRRLESLQKEAEDGALSKALSGG